MTFGEALEQIRATEKRSAVYTSKSGTEVRLKFVKGRLVTDRVLVMSVNGKGWEAFNSGCQRIIKGVEYTERLILTKNMLLGDWVIKTAKVKK